jgi:hypothetical protein
VFTNMTELGESWLPVKPLHSFHASCTFLLYFPQTIWALWWSYIDTIVSFELCSILGSLQFALFLEPFTYKNTSMINSGRVSDEHLSERWIFILIVVCIGIIHQMSTIKGVITLLHLLWVLYTPFILKLMTFGWVI